MQRPTFTRACDGTLNDVSTEACAKHEEVADGQELNMALPLAGAAAAICFALEETTPSARPAMERLLHRMVEEAAKLLARGAVPRRDPGTRDQQARPLPL